MAIEMIETDETRELAHVMCVLDRSGDTKIMWDEDNKDEVANAQRTFDDLTRKGMWAYKTDKEGNKAERVQAFDKHAERLILAPRPVGG